MSGKLSENIAYFARALRDAGLPIGPGAVLDAVNAVEAAHIGTKEDFYWTLHAIFVKKRDQSEVFDQAFRNFFRRRSLIEKIIATLSPYSPSKEDKPKKPDAGALRAAEALLPPKKDLEPPKEEKIELDARFTVSEREILQTKDFAQMTADEVMRARRLIASLVLPDDQRPTRRYVPSRKGKQLDPRRTFRSSVQNGGGMITLKHRDRAEKSPPIVAICDISGSMADYTRIFLHFLHALTDKRKHVQTFLFGTRLTNVTRSLKSRDPDEALAKCSEQVADWSGGTRIGTSLSKFNRLWARRVLGQGAIVLMFTDGLERDGTEELAKEIGRLHRSCSKLVWLNPLLRYDGFEAKAAGIRTILPEVDEFRPIHNLKSLEMLVEALSVQNSQAADPRLWLKRVA